VSIRALLPFDAELVLTCADCGEASTASLGGVEGWTLRRVSAQRLVDICPCCAPAKPARNVGLPKAGRV
jgi:hypothetical protein